MNADLCRGRVFILSFEESKIGSYLKDLLIAENFHIQLTKFQNGFTNDDLLSSFFATEYQFFVFVEIAYDLELMFKKYLRSKNCYVKIICCHLFPKRICFDFGSIYDHSPDVCCSLSDEEPNIAHSMSDMIEISCDICRIILNNTLHPFQPVKQCCNYEKFVALKQLSGSLISSVVIFGCNLLSFNVIRCLLDHTLAIIVVDDEIVHKHDLLDGIYSEDDLFKKKCTSFRQKFSALNKNCTILDCNMNAKAMSLKKWDSFKQQRAIVVLTVHENTYKRYVHKMCLYSELPIIDVGSDCLKFHVNISVPFQTETYFSFNDPPEKISYPLCTIKSFPSSIEHCVEWALQKWSSFGNRKFPALQSWTDCLKWSRITFEKHFNHKPRQLLVNIPENNRKESGVLFWNEHKQPRPLMFSIDDQLCVDFLLAFAKLSAISNNIMITDCDKKFLCEVIECTNIPNFVSKQELTITETAHEHRREAMASTNFTFDNDDHCLLLYSATNLRANVYGIPTIIMDRFKKMSLNLVECSALAVTTAAVCIEKELQKLLVGNGFFREQKLEIKNYYANLADNDLFIVCEPLPSKQLMLNSMCFNEWDSWTIYEKSVDDTLEALLQTLKNESNGLDCTMLVMENGDCCKTLFMSILPECASRKHKSVRQLMDVGQRCDLTFVVLIACFDTENEDQCLSPFVKYYFANSSELESS